VYKRKQDSLPLSSLHQALQVVIEFPMPRNHSLLLSQEPQEQVLPLLLYGFSQTLASLAFLGKTVITKS